MLLSRLANTVANLVLFVLIPFVVYAVVQRRRQGRSLGESLQRVGMQRGEPGFLRYAWAGLAIVFAWVWLVPPDLEVITREGTVQAAFAGAGISVDTLGAALLYALVQTGFAEEFLFRGLIAGSLSRRMTLWRANVVQAAIFLAPHLILLFIVPEHWPILILIFGGALFAGWLRIASGSMVGPWILHGGANLAVTLSVLGRTLPA